VGVRAQLIPLQLIPLGAVVMGVVAWGCSGGSTDDGREAATRSPPPAPVGRIVYQDGGRLWIFDVATSRRRRVTTSQTALEPAFDRTGSMIAFRSDREDLFVTEPDGRAVRNVTRSDAEERSPDWTRDGRRLVFVGAETFQFRIWSIGVNGRRLVRITENYAEEPAVSPDGQWIAFRGDTPGTNADIYLARITGADVKQLTRFPDWESEPAWSPDGSRLVFSRGSPTGSLGGRKLWIIDRNGRNARQLTRASTRSDDGPTWSPDGAWIAFSRDGSLRLITPDGRSQRRLNVRGEFPDWGP
jgi:Tol biopolymer transport system component